MYNDPLVAVQKRIDILVQRGQLTQAQAQKAKTRVEAAKGKRPPAPVRP
jgi:hypothetical protein